MERQQVVGLAERRKAPLVEEVRIIQRIGVKVNGQWVWTEHEITPPTQAESPSPEPLFPQAGAGKTPKPLTMGRDPGEFLITFGRFFKENNQRPIKISLVPERDLYDWWEKCSKFEDKSPMLEVALEMIEAYLLDIQYTPPAKYQDSRRRR